MQTQDIAVFKSQTAILDEVVKVTTILSRRLREVEAQLESSNKRSNLTVCDDVQETREPAENSVIQTSSQAKRKQSPKMSLLDAWYDWFACRSYLVKNTNRQKQHTQRKLV